MPLDAYMTKGVLDWILGGAAAPTLGAGRFIGYATGSPNKTDSSDAPGYRATLVMAAAVTGATATASNAQANTCTMTAAASVVAWNLYTHTSSANAAGCRLAYGFIAAGVKGASGDYFQCAIGAMKITLT